MAASPPLPVIEPSRPQRLPRPTPEESRIAGLIFVTGTFFGMGLMVFFLQIWGNRDDEDIEHYRSVRDLVMETYVGQTTEQELLESALRGMLGELDEYSRYYVEDEVDAVNQDTTGQTIGIGVILRYRPEPTVLFPVAGSPAEKAGLRVGDKIIQLDGEPTEGVDQEELSTRIRGLEGTELAMTVLGRDGQTRELVVNRHQILVPSVRRRRMLDEEKGIGYLALVSFSNETMGEFDAAVEALKQEGMRALIIDLRGNPGGVLSAAVGMAGRFIPEGILTSTEGRGAPEIEYAQEGEAHYVGLPLVVLMDGNSASASEVFAGAIQDYRVGALVGTPSYGKGVVQTISRYLHRRAIAKLTTSYYYTPAHRNLQRSSDDSHAFGLSPDVLVEVPFEESDEVLRFLFSYEAPPSCLPELRAWALEDPDLDLTLDPPPDAQLEAALQLFSGKLPDVASNE